MDASSHYQETLPVSSDSLLNQLQAEAFTFQRFDHVPLRTVQDSKQVRQGFLTAQNGGGHIKNLYLRDKKKQNYLLVLQEDRDIDLKVLAEKIGAGRLSFGSTDRLFEHLGVRPGAVTPLAMITGARKNVSLFLDRVLIDTTLIYMHPLVNDRTIGMHPAALERFLVQIEADYRWIDFDL